jgi:hypothetical protein
MIVQRSDYQVLISIWRKTEPAAHQKMPAVTAGELRERSRVP